jgi:hypothetical protein
MNEREYFEDINGISWLRGIIPEAHNPALLKSMDNLNG